jgi:hypothetical protein
MSGCECPCEQDTHMITLPVAQRAPGFFVRCECALCGGGRCKVRVSPVAKAVVSVETARQRGSANVKSFEIDDSAPTLCEACLSHPLLTIRRNAVQRARTSRSSDDDAVKRARTSRSSDDDKHKEMTPHASGIIPATEATGTGTGTGTVQ